MIKKVLVEIVAGAARRFRKLRLKYKRIEYEVLYPGRVVFSDTTHFLKFPEIQFDGSASRLILKDKVVIRGVIRFVFFKNGVIEVGENTFFNSGCSLTALESVKIGRDCLFGENVKIYDHNHNFRDNTKLIREQGYTAAAVTIGNNCWIGSNVTILKGVTIGDNVVVGANTLVYKSIPSSSLVRSSQTLEIMPAEKTTVAGRTH